MSNYIYIYAQVGEADVAVSYQRLYKLEGPFLLTYNNVELVKRLHLESTAAV